jgi:hypothetical protein
MLNVASYFVVYQDNFNGIFSFTKYNLNKVTYFANTYQIRHMKTILKIKTLPNLHRLYQF